MKAVTEHGWEQFRPTLLSISYSELLRAQLPRIASFQLPLPANRPLGQVAAASAEKAADRLGTDLIARYPFNGKDPFYSFAEPNKYWICGKEKGQEFPLTRIYLGQKAQFVSEVFTRLFTELKKRGCLSRLDLALNRDESFDPDGPVLLNNAIIIYVMKSDLAVMRNICLAIAAAEVDLGLSAAERAHLTEDNIRDFMVPLADTVAFVEMPGNNSYHADARNYLFKHLFGRPPYMGKLSLTEIQREFDRWSPADPGLMRGKFFEKLECRRKYLPALVF
ncbi:MAG: hypothetical protein WC529_08210 [Candidatus Margulisiibacteriota bacterium]